MQRRETTARGSLVEGRGRWGVLAPRQPEHCTPLPAAYLPLEAVGSGVGRPAVGRWSGRFREPFLLVGKLSPPLFLLLLLLDEVSLTLCERIVGLSHVGFPAVDLPLRRMPRIGPFVLARSKQREGSKVHRVARGLACPTRHGQARSPCPRDLCPSAHIGPGWTVAGIDRFSRLARSLEPANTRAAL